jgi:hypothetical protein
MLKQALLSDALHEGASASTLREATDTVEGEDCTCARKSPILGTAANAEVNDAMGDRLGGSAAY